MKRQPLIFIDWVEIALALVIVALAVGGFVYNVNGQGIKPIPVHDCDTCGCGGLKVDGVVEMAAGREVTVWIDSGSIAGLSVAKTRTLLIEGINEFDIVCGVRFRIVDRKAGARIRVEFVPDINNLGQAWSSGLIQLNSTRKIGNAVERRIVQALICHELGHVLGLVHGGGRSDIMHPHLGIHWSVAEVQTLQRKHGVDAAETWHPTDRVQKGKELRSAMEGFTAANESFRAMAEQRNQAAASGEWDRVKELNVVVKDRLAKRTRAGELVAKRHGEWWEINRAWNTSGVGGVVRLSN